MMKTLPIAAIALLAGTSAYAMTPSTQPTGVRVNKDPFTVTQMTTFGTAAGNYELQPAAVDWWGTAPATELKTVSYEDAGAPAGAVTETAEKADAAVDEAVDEAADEADAETGLEPVAAETSALDEAPIPVETAAADLNPRPAAQNYPACSPGPGDDNCIQLYEPGVRQRLAAWTQPTGGFAGAGETQVAMGGPYEPVDNSAVENARIDNAAWNGDGSVNTAMGESDEDEDLAEA